MYVNTYSSRATFTGELTAFTIDWPFGEHSNTMEIAAVPVSGFFTPLPSSPPASALLN